jgi:hypothetical protein
MFQAAKQYLKGLKVDGLIDLTGGKIELNYNLITTQTKTFVAADCGKIWLASYAGASTFTLPANTSAKAGRILIIGQTVAQDLTIVAATADTLLTDGDLQADSVAFSTGSHQIGSLALILGIGGSWIAFNLSGTTMTVNS